LFADYIAANSRSKIPSIVYTPISISSPLPTNLPQLTVTPETTPSATTNGQLSLAMLTSDDINQVWPSLWADYELSKDQVIPPDECGLECFQRGWATSSQNGILEIDIIELGNASTAENELQKDMAAAKDISYVSQYFPRVEYLPDHTWLGINEGKNLSVFFLLTQDQDYFVRTWLFDSTTPITPQIEALETKMIFLITGKLWAKLLDLGYVSNVSFSPLNNATPSP
jgi:hypothetical protein